MVAYICLIIWFLLCILLYYFTVYWTWILDFKYINIIIIIFIILIIIIAVIIIIILSYYNYGRKI